MQGGEGKELQHKKAKAMRKKVTCGILFYFYRSVPDFGKVCQEDSALPTQVYSGKLVSEMKVMPAG